jgi:cytochrome c-type biogenesis protein
MRNADFFLSEYNQYLLAKQGLPILLLAALGLIGGLISSLSPCVLSLLPLNLAYIGTAEIKNPKEAFIKALLFVIGVAMVLTLLGVFSSLAFAVFTEHRALLNLFVGLFIILMSLTVIEIIKVPLPQFFTQMPKTNPLFIGMVFALVSSPCASPILFGVLSMASTAGSVAASMLIMFMYSIGYTAIIFLASLSAGLIKQLNWFKQHHKIITKISAVLLAIIGLIYVYFGVINLEPIRKVPSALLRSPSQSSLTTWVNSGCSGLASLASGSFLDRLLVGLSQSPLEQDLQVR